MSEVRQDVVAEDSNVAEVEAEIREFVRRDVTHLRRPNETGAGAVAASNLNSVVQRVAGSTLREIDLLVRELESLREILQTEGERVQQELTTYAQLSQSAMASTKAIAESVQQWKKHADTFRKH
jgi:hypothetical protein